MKFPFRLRYRAAHLGFAFLLFGLTSCDLHSESGRWQGNLAVYDSRTRESYSCPVELELTRTSEFVQVRSLDVTCGSRSVHWTSGTYTQKGMEFVQGGRHVGDSYPFDSVRLELQDPFYNDNYPNRVSRLSVSWTVHGDSLKLFVKEEFDGYTRSLDSSPHELTRAR